MLQSNLQMASDCITNGIRVKAESVYLDEYSQANAGHHLFCYKITIINEGDRTVELLSRHWIIIDSESHREEVKGEGVVGKQPRLAPGESHEYFSFCPLETNFGSMEGSFHMLAEDGEEFDAKIDRFFLSTNLEEFPKNQFQRGQIVQHKNYDYRGVVIDFDMYFMYDEDWYQANKTQPPKNKPWYHVLVDKSNQVTYVAQDNLENSNDLDELDHPLTEFFFDRFDGQKYVRNTKKWQDLQ